MDTNCSNARNYSSNALELLNAIKMLLNEVLGEIESKSFWDGSSSYAACNMINGILNKLSSPIKAFEHTIPNKMIANVKIIYDADVLMRKAVRDYENHTRLYNNAIRNNDKYSANQHMIQARNAMAEINRQSQIITTAQSVLQNMSIEGNEDYSDISMFLSDSKSNLIFINTDKVDECGDKLSGKRESLQKIIDNAQKIQKELTSNSDINKYVQSRIDPYISKLNTILTNIKENYEKLCVGLDECCSSFNETENYLISNNNVADISEKLGGHINFVGMDAQTYSQLIELFTKDEYKDLSATQLNIAAMSRLSKAIEGITVIEGDTYRYSQDDPKKIVGMDATDNEIAEYIEGDCSSYVAQILKQVTGVYKNEEKGFEEARFVKLNGKNVGFSLTHGYTDTFEEIKQNNGVVYKESDIYNNGRVNTDLLQPGDIICFHSGGKAPTHVAIYSGDNLIAEGVSSDYGAALRDVSQSNHYTNGVNEYIQIFRSKDARSGEA